MRSARSPALALIAASVRHGPRNNAIRLGSSRMVGLQPRGMHTRRLNTLRSQHLSRPRHCSSSSTVCCGLGSKRSTFFSSFKTTRSSRRPGDDISTGIRNSDDGVIESGLNMSHSIGNILFTFFCASSSFWLRHVTFVVM